MSAYGHLSEQAAQVTEHQSLKVFKSWWDMEQCDPTLRLDLTLELILHLKGIEWD